MIPVSAAMGAIKGLTGIAGGIIGSGKRKREEAAAQEEYDMFKTQYAELDTSNLYANLENTMEDLTVDQRAAEFQLQAQQQGQANIMDQMSGAAGGSGIAALAQAMANQQTQGAAQAAASIGQQERSNQMAQAQMAGQLQSQEAQGAEQARSLEYSKTSTQLGMAQQRLGAAKQARAAATQSIMGGVGGLLSAGVEAGSAEGGFLDGIVGG
ncbi:hypothetical protein N9D22_05290 [Flavobacteriaceae bacterium]|nr:hypothetical protein [Flavobacteriaceae bacterium]